MLRGIALAVLVAALLPASAAAIGRAVKVKNASDHPLEEGIKSTSVAIAPDGTPWFGLEIRTGEGTRLAHVSAGKLSLVPVPVEVGEARPYSSTSSLRFDAAGNLWFVRYTEGGGAIMRRSPDGTVTEVVPARIARAESLTIGAEGDLWFARSDSEGNRSIGRATPDGAVTEFPLASKAGATSLTLGPDGAIWFTEQEANEIDRITPSGDITTFPLGAGVDPRQLVAGPDGAIWFTENGVPARHRRSNDRIGRLAADGAVTQFPIRFGRGTEALTIDPRGFIWFTTEEGEVSSISTSGAVGGRGCPGYCGGLYPEIRVGPRGGLWLSVGTRFCGGCGGGSDLIAENEGTSVIKIPAGALRPAVE